MWAYADTVGVALDCRNRLTVISAWGSNLSQSCFGKSSATPARMLRKCALKLRIATSAALRLWQPGGTSSSLYWLRMSSFIVSDTSLSNTCFCGMMLARFNRSISAWYARIISASLRLFMGSTTMPLLSMSTMTIMYLLPESDLVGNCPV